MKRILALLLCLALMFGCTPAQSSGSVPEGEPEDSSEGSSASISESVPESGSDAAPSDGGEKSIPYLPEEMDPFDIYPSYLGFDGSSDFDTSRNNQTKGDLSFYLDESAFSEVATEYSDFWIFTSVQDSSVGPCRVSLQARDVTSLDLTIRDESGTLLAVPTMNADLQDFLRHDSIGSIYSYFAENVNGCHISGAIFAVPDALGFIFFFTDDVTVYSIQFLTYDTNYAQQNIAVMTDLIGSLVFLSETR